jgi:hypothetical protein
MSILNFIAGIAAIILALEVLVVAILFMGIATGLWFGLRFGQRRMGRSFSKVNTALSQATAIERKGLALAVQPFIQATATGQAITATVKRLLTRLQGPRM